MVLHIPRKAGAAGAHTAQLLLQTSLYQEHPFGGCHPTLKVPHPWLVTAPYKSPSGNVLQTLSVFHYSLISLSRTDS